MKWFIEWELKNSFCVITGKNGVGKSTVLWYLRDILSEYFKSNVNSEFVETSKTERKKIIIPVIFRMQDAIQQNNSTKNYSFTQIINDFLRNYEDFNRKKLEKAIEVFMCESIEKLILI